MKSKAHTRTELARMYNVCYDTLNKWLNTVPDLNLANKQRVLTPKQVQKIFEHLGEP